MNHCEGCELSSTGITHQVCIPPPSDKIRGCLISRDPTYAFLEPLERYRQLSVENKGNLWFNAPPCWLCNKIRIFMNFSEGSPEMIKLRDFLNYECYWTHLHKCPTSKPGKIWEKNEKGSRDINEYFPQFRYSNAKSCANRWFGSEFDKFNLNGKIIITCGRDVEKFFSQWLKQEAVGNNNNIINLPHPSSANCGNGWSWNKNSDHKESITNQINQLLKLI